MDYPIYIVPKQSVWSEMILPSQSFTSLFSSYNIIYSELSLIIFHNILKLFDYFILNWNSLSHREIRIISINFLIFYIFNIFDTWYSFSNFNWLYSIQHFYLIYIILYYWLSLIILEHWESFIITLCGTTPYKEVIT